MGVTGLWTVVQPCARPIKLETLNKKRLAVDASIWIYQFLKAVRDKEGNALRNSHVVGFFRRICKLLFFGIKPVFVFDGGAPALKRQTISGRKARREGRREDAVRTAGKLLAVQMQRRAEEEDRKRRDERSRPAMNREEEKIPDDLVYVDELQMTAQERQQNRQFKKKDAYHLPDLDVSLSEMGAPNDPRIMSHEELEEYARQFHTGEDVNIYDFGKMDFNSPMFISLPASDRYNILNAARLRSRLRMGYSKDQLDTMFPDRMAFSRFQIERVKERNELTTRLMNISGMNGEDAMFGINGGGRVAGEKGKEYVLVKNDGVEGGWALGVVSNKHDGERNKPIEVEGFERNVESDEDGGDEWEDDGFVDVPIEGLNRLPKLAKSVDPINEHDEYEHDETIERRRNLYDLQQDTAGPKKNENQEILEEDPESLFIPQEKPDSEVGVAGEDDDTAFFGDVNMSENEEDELNRAIAMSLEEPEAHASPQEHEESRQVPRHGGPRIDQPLEFNQKNAEIGRAFAHSTNARAHGTAQQPFVTSRDDGNDPSLQAAIVESRHTTNELLDTPYVNGSKKSREPTSPPISSVNQPHPSANLSSSAVRETMPENMSTFDGPLPFESINLGRSLFSKKKKKPIEDDAGGFEKAAPEPKQQAAPLPPWFSGDVRKDSAAQRLVEDRQYDGGNPQNSIRSIDDHIVLKRQKTGEVIDLDAPRNTGQDVVELESSSEGEDNLSIRESPNVNLEFRMNDVADLVCVEPPESKMPRSNNLLEIGVDQETNPDLKLDQNDRSNAEEAIEWEESDVDSDKEKPTDPHDIVNPSRGSSTPRSPRVSSPELENIGIPDSPRQPQSSKSTPTRNEENDSFLVTNQSQEQELGDIIPADEEDIYSDPEEDDLMRQLAVEAEEHARFASTLNSKSQLQNAEDYERELRQLRNQQKKDRRDADEVSHIMVTECQQLLKLFGLPYVTAPMEAEAQCAELVSLGLVDGIVTDDSDIFLFGGTRVYKNMFNQAKFVECYLSSDLEKEYSLDRQKVIQIAHLLGSDYTEGIPSIGPVTALEILSEFDSLEAFKDWWSHVQMGHKFPEDASSPFRRKFRRNAAKLFLPPTFPDKRVDHAYLHPDVDSDPSPFAWGVPDLDALRQFLMATVGWSQERADEILVPVIRDMNRRETEGTQANITQFFGGTVGIGARQKAGNNGSGAFAPRRRVEGKSQRMENALGMLHARAKERTIGEGDAERGGDGEVSRVDGTGAEANTGEVDNPITTRPRTRRPKQKKRPILTEAPASTSGSGDDYETPKRTKKRTKKRRRGN